MERLAHTYAFSAQPKLNKALNYLLWFGLIYLIFIVVYSVFYWHFVAKLQTEFIDHVFWWLKNTGAWFVFAPVCLVYFTQKANQPSFLKHLAFAGFAMVLIAVILQISFDYAYLKKDLLGYVVLYLPRQIGIFIIVCAYWYLFVMYKHSNEAAHINNVPAEQTATTTEVDYIDLEHLGRPYRLNMNTIWLVKSAGNYVEIHSEQGQFLKRSSLKQLQRSLPDYFCQCHRSIIINLQHLHAINSHSSGHAIATLRNGEQANISKRYKSSVKARLAEYPIQAP